MQPTQPLSPTAERLKNLPVGGCMFFEPTDCSSVHNAILLLRAEYGYEFELRKRRDGGIKVWRILPPDTEPPVKPLTRRAPPKPKRADRSVPPPNPTGDDSVGVVRQGVPIPEHTPNTKYLFGVMEVGDCVDYPIEYANNVRTALQTHKRKRGGRFATRTVGMYIRVWRTA